MLQRLEARVRLKCSRHGYGSVDEAFVILSQRASRPQSYRGWAERPRYWLRCSQGLRGTFDLIPPRYFCLAATAPWPTEDLQQCIHAD